ncbi:hypothetical protein EYF80_053027 [Liparis tanakae]|uniref:Uncharacterized protein n=1 Tax=Liparis tanakae TaxID=230148 RepID=A0A4Z2F6M2_9TELE|nr:hypothetical protein EYF80_053027 [Liparis tanakae]
MGKVQVQRGKEQEEEEEEEEENEKEEEEERGLRMEGRRCHKPRPSDLHPLEQDLPRGCHGSVSRLPRNLLPKDKDSSCFAPRSHRLCQKKHPLIS